MKNQKVKSILSLIGIVVALLLGNQTGVNESVIDSISSTLTHTNL